MKQGTVRVSQEFTMPDGNKKWLAHERQYDMDTEDPLEVFAKADSIMNAFAKSSTPGFSDNSIPPGPPPVIAVERTSEDQRIAELIRDIYACTELDGPNGLWTYNKLASTRTEVQLAYDVMGKKLRAKESSELLEKCNVKTK